MELCCKQAGWRRPHSPAQLAGGEERDHIGLLVINCCPFLFLWSCFAALFRRKTALVALIVLFYVLVRAPILSILIVHMPWVE